MRKWKKSEGKNSNMQEKEIKEWNGKSKRKKDND